MAHALGGGGGSLEGLLKFIPRDINEIEKWPVEGILAFIGGILGIVLSPVFFLYALLAATGARNPPLFMLWSSFQLALALAFSAGAVLAAASIRRGDRGLAYALGVSSGCVLLFLGGLAGMAAGFLCLAGTIVHIFRKEGVLK